MANNNDFAGGGDRDWDRFANGASARRRPAVYCQDNERPQRNYGDAYAQATFGANPFGPPVGKQDQKNRMGSLPPEIYAKHR
jgi:hypothetical protein